MPLPVNVQGKSSKLRQNSTNKDGAPAGDAVKTPSPITKEKRRRKKERRGDKATGSTAASNEAVLGGGDSTPRSAKRRSRKRSGSEEFSPKSTRKKTATEDNSGRRMREPTKQQKSHKPDGSGHTKESPVLPSPTRQLSITKATEKHTPVKFTDLNALAEVEMHPAIYIIFAGLANVSFTKNGGMIFRHGGPNCNWGVMQHPVMAEIVNNFLGNPANLETNKGQRMDNDRMNIQLTSMVSSYCFRHVEGEAWLSIVLT